MVGINIWLDDIRDAPDGWVHLRNIDEVIFLVETARGVKEFYIDKMSFDFHLNHPKLGVDVMEYLAEQCRQYNIKNYWPRVVLYHSSDPKGIKIMKEFATRFEKETLSKYGN